MFKPFYFMWYHFCHYCTWFKAEESDICIYFPVYSLFSSFIALFWIENLIKKNIFNCVYVHTCAGGAGSQRRAPETSAAVELRAGWCGCWGWKWAPWYSGLRHIFRPRLSFIFWLQLFCYWSYNCVVISLISKIMLLFS